MKYIEVIKNKIRKVVKNLDKALDGIIENINAEQGPKLVPVKIKDIKKRKGT